jgi:hypothetical protein
MGPERRVAEAVVEKEKDFSPGCLPGRRRIKYNTFIHRLDTPQGVVAPTPSKMFPPTHPFAGETAMVGWGMPAWKTPLVPVTSFALWFRTPWKDTG